MTTSPPAVRAAATRAARLLRVRRLVRAPVWAYRTRLGASLGTEAGGLPMVALDLVPRAA